MRTNWCYTGTPLRVVALLALAIVSVSCERKPEESASDARPNVAVQFAQLPISYSAVTQLAEMKGDYKNHLVDVRIISAPAGPDVVAALRSPTAAAGGIAITPVITMIAAGEAPVVIATTLESDEQVKLVTFEAAGISGDPKSLRKKRIGVVKGTVGEIYLGRLLDKGGLTSSDVTLVNGRPSDLRTLLVRGDLDAAVLWTPFTVQTVREYSERRGQAGVPDRGEAILHVDNTLVTLAFNLVTTQEKLAANREGLSRMLRALIDTEARIKDDPQEAQRMLESWLELQPGDLDDLFATTRFRVHLDVDDIQRWMREELTWYKQSRPEAEIPNNLDPYTDATLLREIDGTRVRE